FKMQRQQQKKKSRRSSVGPIQLLTKTQLSEIKHRLINERVELYRRMAVGARKQYNFTVADKYLRLSLKARDKETKKNFEFGFFSALVKLHCLKAKHAKHEVDIIDKYAKALKFLEGKKSEPVIVNENRTKLKFLMLQGNIYEALYRLS